MLKERNDQQQFYTKHHCYFPIIDFEKIEAEIQRKILATDIPAVVMGKICKNGDMSFYFYGPSRWGKTIKLAGKIFLLLPQRQTPLLQ